MAANTSPEEKEKVTDIESEGKIDIENGYDEKNLNEDDSPYPEVRSAVANTDDPELPVSTVRSWTLGIAWAILIPGLNQFFWLRYPSVLVGGIVAQLLSFPLGKMWERTIPNWSLFGISLNPGPFNIKEHVLITVMATVGVYSSYTTDVVLVQRVYYNQEFNFIYQWLLIMSTTLLGFSICGIAKHYLIDPPSMIWPYSLVTCTLFNTLHAQEYAGIGNRGGISRLRFFFYAFIGSAVWYIVPGYLFTALSYFTWVCWIAPDNAPLNQMFGYSHGMGMSIFTFDWAQIAYIGSPLATPWWAIANIMVGFVVFFWILTPALYFSNTWYSMYMPISDSVPYDNTGAPYDITQIIDTDKAILNEAAYHQYSPLFLTTTYIVAYGALFASTAATLMHTLLFFRKHIWINSRRAMQEQPDVHARLMSRYKQVPQWWYATIFVTMFAFACITIEVWDTGFTIPYLIVALLIALCFVIPIGMIQALTNQQISLTALAELLIGYALPGRPIATMLFKTWCFVSMTQALSFALDMKLCHYMKIPPRSMFFAQVLASIIAATAQLGVQSWMVSNIDNLCAPDQAAGFSCPWTQVLFTSSVVNGLIGPARMFSVGQIYAGVLFFFLFGFLAPVVQYLILMKWPDGPLKYLNIPVVLGGLVYLPPATAVNYIPWAIVGFIFQFVIKRRHFSWWSKYNYVLSAGLDAGLAISALLIFFCLQYPKNGTIGENSILTWWGNWGAYDNVDGNALGVKYVDVEAGEIFGPSEW